MHKPRFIEESFPANEVSQHSRKEKSIRQGHLSTLSTWWARRPLSTSRAMIFLSAIPSISELEKNSEVKILLRDIYPNIDSCEDSILKLTADLSKFENSDNRSLLECARKIIKLTSNKLSLLDSFSGGGSIPLESLRLGITTHASDLNPIATTGLFLSLNLSTNIGSEALLRLKDDIRHIKNEIENLYYNERDCLAYFYAKVTTCPSCKKGTPLFQNKWLSKKGKVRAFNLDTNEGKLIFSILEPKTDEQRKEASIGTIKSKTAKCVFCEKTFPTSVIQSEAIDKGLNDICIAKCTSTPEGKEYSLVTDNERGHNLKLSDETKEWISNNFELKLDKNGIRHLWAIQYGSDSVNKLFNETQLNSLILISHLIYKHREHINSTSQNDEEALYRYISLIMILNKTAVYNNKHSWWQSNGAFPASIFVRQAISMIWNYVEIPQSSVGAGGWDSASKWVLKVLDHLNKIDYSANVKLSDAENLDHKDQSIDIIAIDPPYFDSITYAYLSDFFYPWMKALLKEDFPAWFNDYSTPKSNELIVDRKHKLAPNPKDQSFFKQKLTASLIEANRVLKDDGILTIMYGHKGVDAWITLFECIFNSGFKVTASWPVHTERKVKFQHSRVDALETSCLLTLRKNQQMSKPKIAFDDFLKKAKSLSAAHRKKHCNFNSDADKLMSIFPVVLSEYFSYEIMRNKKNGIQTEDIEYLLSVV